MNWFERYGIAGNYAVALGLLYVFIFFPDTLPDKPEAILGIGALLFLPIGYLVSILSQWCIYGVEGFTRPIHKNVMNFLIKKEGIALSSPKSELEAENCLAMKYREICDPDERASRDLNQEFARKRWDVIAIDNSLILTTLVYLTISVLTIFSMRQRLCFNQTGFALSFLFGLGVLVILLASRAVMARQLEDIYKVLLPRVFRYKYIKCKCKKEGELDSEPEKAS